MSGLDPVSILTTVAPWSASIRVAPCPGNRPREIEHLYVIERAFQSLTGWLDVWASFVFSDLDPMRVEVGCRGEITQRGRRCFGNSAGKIAR